MCLLMVCDFAKQCLQGLGNVGLNMWDEFDEDESCNERSTLKLEVGCTAVLGGAVYDVPSLEDIPQL